MSGAEAMLRRHLTEAQFVSGELDGQWRLTQIEWPFVIFEVTDRFGHAFALRLECSGYPMCAPTGTFWDRSARAMLDFRYWPRGTRSNQAFRPDWQAGAALYLPCDRVTILAHERQWVFTAPTLMWRPELGITCYLKAVHGILQEHDLSYSKADGSACAVA